MIAYLKGLFARPGGGYPPIWILRVGTKHLEECYLINVDEVGIVVAGTPDPKQGVAYPWASITSVAPKHD